MNQVIYEDFCNKMDKTFVEGGSILMYLYFGNSYVSLDCHLEKFNEHTDSLYLETEEGNNIEIELNEQSEVEYDAVEDEYILTTDKLTVCVSFFG